MADEPRLIKSEWLVRPVDITTARALVEAHHYAAGASNTAVYLHGLFRVADPGVCLGVAWWIPPTKHAARSVFVNWTHVLALSRLVIAPGVPKNACSFLLARSRINGRMTARKTASKTRTHAEMLALGAEMVGAFPKYKFVRAAGPVRNPFL